MILLAISIAGHLFKHQVEQNVVHLDNAFSKLKCNVQTVYVFLCINISIMFTLTKNFNSFEQNS